jgi:hypothetical protein
MYIVKRNNKQFKSVGYHSSYEEARSAVRKYIRKNKKRLEEQMDKVLAGMSINKQMGHPFWLCTDGEFNHSNPAISSYGFKVVKV